MHIEKFIFNAFQENCSVAYDSDGICVIVDPGFLAEEEKKRLYGFIQSKGLKVKAILLTHGHFDHIFGVCGAALDFNAEVYMHPADRVILEEANPMLCKAFGLPVPQSGFSFREIGNGDTIKVGSMTFEVIGTPGHTPGGVCYLEREAGVIFTGDTLFAGSIGRTDNIWADYDAMMAALLGKLMELDGDYRVIPGHGPETDIATERMTNPFLMPFNEPFENQ